MRVFVAGATGVLGRRAVARLVAAGHEVTGVSRSPEKDALLESLGARPVRVDLFDADALRAAVARARRGRQRHDQDPADRADGADERVGGERADPPRGVGQSRRRRDRGGRDGVRAGVARVHVRRARRASGSTRRPRRWRDGHLQRRDCRGRGERRPLHVRRADAEWCCASAASTRPTAIRSLAMMQYARRGMLLDVGRADSYFPMIDADDAAAAVVAALDAPAGTYDVVDEPMQRARAERARWRPRSDAAGCGARRAGWRRRRPSYLAASQRVSNRAFRDATGWRPLVARRAARLPQARAGVAHRTGAARPGAAHALGARVQRVRRRRAGRSSSRARSTTTSRSGGAGSRWTVVTTSTSSATSARSTSRCWC